MLWFWLAFRPRAAIAGPLAIHSEDAQREEYLSMTASPRPDSFEVIDYLRVLRRRGWIAFALACLGVLAAAAYLTVAPKSYTASASVAVTPNAANTGQVAGSRT